MGSAAYNPRLCLNAAEPRALQSSSQSDDAKQQAPTVGRSGGAGDAAGAGCDVVAPPVGMPLVGVLMGSSSDWETMQQAAQILAEFRVPHECRVVSAHRMPDDMFAYAEAAAGRGLVALIAGAGGAAHLPGMLAAKTTVPVLGVPVASRHLSGVDSLHSIVQMPKGVPVATFAIGAAGAANAALFAVAMLATRDAELRSRLDAFRARQTEAARAMSAALVPGRP